MGAMGGSKSGKGILRCNSSDREAEWHKLNVNLLAKPERLVPPSSVSDTNNTEVCVKINLELNSGLPAYLVCFTRSNFA
jgi:hypothetical protein